MDLGLAGLEQKTWVGTFSMSTSQLPLGLRLPIASRLDNFVAGPNREVFAAVRQLAQDKAGALFLAGAVGLGKTHLLQAACRAVEAAGGHGTYLPLRDARGLDPVLTEGLEHYALVAVDDIDAIAGLPQWETALFHLYNRLHEMGAGLMVAAQAPPDRLGLALPDLRSRLAAAPVYVLQAVDDAARLQILSLRAQASGLELPQETAQFLLRRCPRDLPALTVLLDRLDQAALRAQRRLTVPFVREVLGDESL